MWCTALLTAQSTRPCSLLGGAGWGGRGRLPHQAGPNSQVGGVHLGCRGMHEIHECWVHAWTECFAALSTRQGHPGRRCGRRQLRLLLAAFSPWPALDTTRGLRGRRPAPSAGRPPGALPRRSPAGAAGDETPWILHPFPAEPFYLQRPSGQCTCEGGAAACTAGPRPHQGQ